MDSSFRTRTLDAKDPIRRDFLFCKTETVQAIRRCIENDNPTEQDRIQVALWLLFAEGTRLS